MISGNSGQAQAAAKPAAAKPAAAKPAATDRVAVIQGQPVTLGELETAAAERLEQLEMQRLQQEHRLQQERQQLLLASLGELVEERLLGLEAKARGIDSQELLRQEVKVEPVTDQDIDNFYIELQQQRQGVPPKDRIEGQIRAHLEQQRQAEARESFFEGLRAKYAVEVLLQEPRAEVAADGFPSKGPASAPVTIVEFSDFECPFCSRVVPTLEQVQQKYGDQVRLVFRQFPLNSIHPNAQKAAEASLCAHDQGKFWEMHDLMFEEQKQLTVAELKDKARRVGADGARFDECLDSNRHADAVRQDLREGMVVGVSGTPAMFINGRFLSGAVPFEQIAQIVDEELAKAARQARR
jgi:protein-disulfide isomerase